MEISLLPDYFLCLDGMPGSVPVVYISLIDSGSKGMQVWPFLVRLVPVSFPDQ